VAGRIRKIRQKLNIVLKAINEEIMLKEFEPEYKAKTAVDVLHFLTQKIIRLDKIKKLIEHECHRARLSDIEKP
jgi:CYTH domain-containing protein